MCVSGHMQASCLSHGDLVYLRGFEELFFFFNFKVSRFRLYIFGVHTHNIVGTPVAHTRVA